MAENLKLSKRLAAITDMIPFGAGTADIGTDHGYIPAYLAIKSICKKIYACDIKDGPLNSAVKTAREYGVEEKIKFILTDGLRGLEKYDFNTVIIAGMGGETICGILDGAKWLKNREHTLILQPQSKMEELSQWLCDNGYYIKSANIVEENKKIYPIISVTVGNYDFKSLPEVYIYKALSNCKNPYSESYINEIIEKKRAALSGLESSKDAKPEKIKKTEEILSELTDIKKEMEK